MIKSPITGNDSELICEFNVKDIVNLYKNDFQLDVSSYFEGLDTFSLCECKDTAFRFYYPFNLAGDSRFYEELSKDNKLYYPSWKWENQKAIELIKSRFSVDEEFTLLDIGCGEGFFLKAISEAFSNVNLVGLEHNELAVTKMNSEAIFAINQYIEQHAEVKPSEYDFIFSFQVLEHVPNVKTFLDACIKALKPGGILFFGVPNNDSFIFRNDLYHVLNLPPHHMGLWGNESLRNLALIFNLKVLHIAEQPADNNNLGIYFKVWLKKYLPGYQRLLYPLFRIPVKLFLRVFTPKRGHTIIASFEKSMLKMK